jgi:hypothetical protein
MGSSTVPVMDWEAHTYRHAVYLNLQMQDLAIRVASDVGMHCLPPCASSAALGAATALGLSGRP